MPTDGGNRSDLARALTQGRPSRGRWLLVTAGALLIAFLVVRFVALRGVDLELSVETLGRFRDWIRGFGWLAPAVFVVLVALRSLLLLSSHVVLILGGVAFGAWAGTLWGAVGLALSASYQFAAARLLGDAWVRPWLGAKPLAAERIARAGPWLVGVVTAHPLGVMTPVHLGAGLVGMSAVAFGTAVALAAPVRAGMYSVLGASVLEWDLTTSLGLAGALCLLTLAPLASSRVRRWVLLSSENGESPQ